MRTMDVTAIRLGQWTTIIRTMVTEQCPTVRKSGTSSNSNSEVKAVHSHREGLSQLHERSEIIYGMLATYIRCRLYNHISVMNYFDEALKFENLYKALKECCKNVRWKDSVCGYENNGIVNTLKLIDEVKSGKYKLSKYQKFMIYEPKKREIIATRLRDRQLQRALCNAGLYNEITKSFILDNTACQVGKGIDFTMKRMKIHMVRYHKKYGNNGWVLKCDIKKFFQSTPHDVAKKAVEKRVSDERVKNLVFDIIDSFEGDTGIGLGSQISQLIQLAVLDDLDHYIKEQLRIKFYIRYMDDFILAHPDKKYLQYCKEQVELRINQLGLQLNDKTAIFPLKQGITFCQWRYIYTETGKILVTMSRKKISKQRQKLKKLYIKELYGEKPKGSAITSLRSWEANAMRGDSYNDVRNMFSWFNKMIREQNYAYYQKTRTAKK